MYRCSEPHFGNIYWVYPAEMGRKGLPVLHRTAEYHNYQGTRGECAEIVRAAGRSGRAASFFVQCRIPPCVDWRIAPPHHPMPWGERRPRRDTGVPEHVRGGSPSFFRGAFWIGPGKGRNVWILRLHFVWRAAIMRIRGTHWEELDPWNIRPYRSPE